LVCSASTFPSSSPFKREVRNRSNILSPEEELHEKAHIDYDRVAIIPNPSVAALYEDALVYETGTAITSSGALTAYSGKKTGRSPLDKRIVKEETSENEIW
jgi:phosphoenolpyruvate carboxykinase (ATP)